MTKQQQQKILFLMNDLLARANRLEERQDKAAESNDVCRMESLKQREQHICGEYDMAYHILDCLGYSVRHNEENGREFYTLERNTL